MDSPLAAQYAAYRKSSAFSLFKEQPTLLRLIGDVEGLDILDVGCGIGHYSQILAEKQANSVVGIDCSQEMIAAACTVLQGDEHPFNLRFQVLDATEMVYDRKFDLVLANFLLCYAENKKKLYKITKNICNSLVPGGRMIGSVYYAEKNADINKALSTGQYGLTVTVPPKLKDGQNFSVAMHDGSSMHSETNYWYSRTTYRGVIRESGFESFQIHPLEVSQEGYQRLGPDFWKPLTEQSIFGVIEATKSNKLF